MNRPLFITFGETMLRLFPFEPGETLRSAGCFRVQPGGSESNVAIALASLGHTVDHATRLPEGPLGERALDELRRFGVGAGRIARGGPRMGVYWTETGVGARAASVIYDRADSAFDRWMSAAPEPDLDGAGWFHCSGITPGLSKEAAATLDRWLREASRSMPTSMDLNYRSRLWWYAGDDRHRVVTQVMGELARHCTVLLGNETDFADCLGVEAAEYGDPLRAFERVAHELFDRYSQLEHVASSHRTSLSATRNGWTGFLMSRESVAQGVSFELDSIVDRVGAGDAFAAGILHGLTTGAGIQETVDFAVGVGALKHSVAGDSCAFSEGEIRRTLETHGHGRIVR